MPDNRKPLIYGAFPVCRNYTVRALLRQPAAETGGTHEADPGMAGAQRHLHHGEHLRPSGFPVETAERRHNGKSPGPARRTSRKPVVRQEKCCRRQENKKRRYADKPRHSAVFWRRRWDSNPRAHLWTKRFRVFYATVTGMPVLGSFL